ncbi:MAG: hypothetical protein HYX54_07870 [Chloroflexi bacterium]|nr:hypothetical protein [Chloroflexota bacterium]
MTPQAGDPIDRLSPGARDRLDRFAEAFQLLDSDLYTVFAASSHDPEDRMAALARVQELIGQGPRREGVLAALSEFREFAVRSATEALGGSNAALLTRTNVATAEDRVRFLASLELAVVTVILWDEIEPEERAQFLGPWEEMAEQASGTS